MEKFLFDLNEILASNFGLIPNEATIFGGTFAYTMLGLVSLFLAFSAIIKLRGKRPSPAIYAQEIHLPPLENEIKVEVGEFGKIVSEKKMTIKGQELDYFIIKKSKYDKDTLPIGTIVVVIKKNAREAYVKPADNKDVVRLKGLL